MISFKRESEDQKYVEVSGSLQDFEKIGLLDFSIVFEKNPRDYMLDVDNPEQYATAKYFEFCENRFDFRKMFRQSLVNAMIVFNRGISNANAFANDAFYKDTVLFHVEHMLDAIQVQGEIPINDAIAFKLMISD